MSARSDAETGRTPRGLPAPLPEGETILWQGRPAWRSLARRAMHLRGLSLYFGAVAVWLLVDGLATGADPLGALAGAAMLAGVGAAVIGFLTVYAWLVARGTFYTLTDRRLILSFGVALPMSMNVPYTLIESAALKTWPNGTGDIPVVVKSTRRLSYLLLWPHVRPWRLSQVEPMLRAVTDAERVARLLSERLRLVHGENAAPAPAIAGSRSPEQAAAPSFAPAAV